MTDGVIRVVVSRHSAFYSPLISTLARGELLRLGFDTTYDVLQPGQRSHSLLDNDEVDVIQSAVASNWGPMEQGATNLPVHFAQINCRDGFFLTSREPNDTFDWKKLEGATLLADHGHQPLLMLRYAVQLQGVDWNRIKTVNVGTVDEISDAFRSGLGQYVHQQGPAPQQLEKEGHGQVVAAVGQGMPEVAFSSLLATRSFLATDKARAFTKVYRETRKWVAEAPPEEIAAVEATFFPDVDCNVLAAAIRHYQKIGTWLGDIAIPRNLYEQALDVFEHGAAVTQRHRYDDVVVSPPE